MNCDTFKTKLLKCRTYADAQPLLEAMNLGVASHSLARIGFNLPESQQAYKENIIADIIQEARRIKEEEEEKRGRTREEEEEERGRHTREEEEEEEEDEEKKTREYEGGDSQISSKPGMQHLDNVHKPTGSGGEPSTGFSDPENQMRETLRRMGVPELAINKVLKEMDKTTVTQRQMLEAVTTEIRKAVNPIANDLKKHREAIITLDKKIKELGTKTQSVPLNISTPTPAPARLQETSTVGLSGMFSQKRRPNLEDIRNEIKEMDAAMDNGLLKRQEPYQ